MPRAEKSASAVRPEGVSTQEHFLNGLYFVPVPDFSDETVWTINQGRAWPALMAVLRALHDQHRRGRTEEIRADAAGGRLTIGLKALARASREQKSENIQTTAILRQLRFLERAGILRMHDGERVIERDPATGKILKGRGRTPPKVIIMTLSRSMMRGGRRAAETGSNRSQKPEETGLIRSLRRRDVRDRNDPPSKETPTEGVSFGNTGRREHPAQGGRPSPPPQAQRQPASGRPEEEQLSAEEQTRRSQQHYLAGKYAEGLGITYDEVVALWKNDHKAFLGRLQRAGIDWRTGKAAPLTSMIDGPPAPRSCRSARERCSTAATPTNSAFAVRQATTDSLTVCSSVAGEAAQALDGPPVSEEERKAIILRDLAQAGLTAGEAGAGAA